MPRPNIQCTVPLRASPLRTESGPLLLTGRIWAACASTRPIPLRILKPETAHVPSYASRTALLNAASRNGLARSVSTTGRSKDVASSASTISETPSAAGTIALPTSSLRAVKNPRRQIVSYSSSSMRRTARPKAPRLVFPSVAEARVQDSVCRSGRVRRSQTLNSYLQWRNNGHAD
jgi:hypothetical protein